MTPLTPFIDNKTGRLTELVYLLADRPLALAHQAVLDAEAEAESAATDDPWFVVASALYQLQTMTEGTLHSRQIQRRLAEAEQAAAKRATRHFAAAV
ncbi:MAG: hypothetical protein HKN03_18370 [Acidimicrobiales bacterium]|nr:hypothetical protein [Acidimicrobiales bacterium]